MDLSPQTWVDLGIDDYIASYPNADKLTIQASPKSLTILVFICYIALDLMMIPFLGVCFLFSNSPLSSTCPTSFVASACNARLAKLSILYCFSSHHSIS
jgi:hypothetical protein